MHPAPLLPMYICFLYHYNPHTYACCTTTTHVHMHATPLHPMYTCKSCKEFVEITGYWVVFQLIHHLYPVTQPNNHPFVILKEVLGSHSTSRHKNNETLPDSHPLLAPSNCSPFVIIASEFPNSPFFLHQKPIHFPRRDPNVVSRIHTKVHLELGEEDPRPGLWSSSQLWL